MLFVQISNVFSFSFKLH